MNSMNNHIMKKMIMHMRQETVEEYLKRGGTIEKIPQVLDTVGGWWGSVLQQPESELKQDTHQIVSWESIQPDKRFDTDDDDRKYWNKLNKRCDKLLKKIKKKTWHYWPLVVQYKCKLNSETPLSEKLNEVLPKD